MIRNITQENDVENLPKRFLTLDFSRGAFIIGMIILHMIGDTLDINTLMANVNNVPLINLIALAILPFLGGLAGFFLLISATGNMVSIYKDLNRGQSIRGIVLKQVFGGFILLVFAMLSEGLVGYHGTIGEFFLYLNRPAQTPWQIVLFGWNIIETVHTIAWCLIINGCIQGLLSLKGNWKNVKNMIISYTILAIIVIGLTQPIWTLIGKLIPGYPFAYYPNGHIIYQPWIGYENFWDIVRAPFIAPLAAPMEPIFPYLAISFIGSIIGIIISQPKEKISKNFVKGMFLTGLMMFISGLIGIIFILIQIVSQSYSVDSFDVMIAFYRFISFHRHWAPDAAKMVFSGEIVIIPPFSWLAQFTVLNGFSIMILMFLFRLIEFRGKSYAYAEKTKIVRRFGVVAFSNYNNQAIYYITFLIISLMLYQTPYQKLSWLGEILAIILTLVVFSLILWGWEKIKYTGSLEWFIRTITNNVVPARKKILDKNSKWWQKGQIDPGKTFYNVQWIEFNTLNEKINKNGLTKLTNERRESKFALLLSLVGLCSILFIIISFIGIFVSTNAIKTEGKNKINLAALIISIIGSAIFIGGLIASLIMPIEVLGIFEFYN